mmetsp:Transcript_5921/g.12562  ORF Transcript_5921/g.12562 Transcript_5921/m.12562 type:complete len:131 (-) Transcript_5921:1725-2117(-)
MSTTKAFQLVSNTTTLATFEDGRRALLTIHLALLDNHPSQHEALLQSYQTQHHGIIFNDISSCHQDNEGANGKHNLVFADPPGTLPLFWDGWKLFFAISLPTANDTNSDLPHYELTSPCPYQLPSSSSIW